MMGTIRLILASSFPKKYPNFLHIVREMSRPKISGFLLGSDSCFKRPLAEGIDFLDFLGAGIMVFVAPHVFFEGFTVRKEKRRGFD